MLVANTELSVDCMPNSVQKILYMLFHALIIWKACKAGIAVRPNIQMRELKYCVPFFFLVKFRLFGLLTLEISFTCIHLTLPAFLLLLRSCS